MVFLYANQIKTLNRITLKFEPDFDFVLIAITSSLKDYRLCHYVNKALDVDFVRIGELGGSADNNEGDPVFNRYAYFPSESETEFYLICNKGTEGFLIPEMNRVDYFLMVKNFIDEEDLAFWLSRIKKLPEVIAAVEVEPKRLKSKENLLF